MRRWGLAVLGFSLLLQAGASRSVDEAPAPSIEAPEVTDDGTLIVGPCRVKTRALGRGIAEPAMLTEVVRRPGVTRVDRGEGVTEELVRRGPAVEQRWWFAEEPAGDGDLVVRVEAPAADCLYGPATWVDATGRRWPVERRADRDGVELRLASATLRASRYPAVLDPLVLPATPVDDTFTLGPAPNGQTVPTIAAGTQGLLAGWSDDRDTTRRVRATRLDTSGMLLDPGGVLIAPPAGSDFAGAFSDGIAFDGTRFIYLWSALTSVSATFVEEDGTVGATKELVSAFPNQLVLASATAAGPGHYLAVYDHGNTGPFDFEALVLSSADHAVIGGPFSLITGTQFQSRDNEAAWVGDRYLLAMATTSGLRVHVIDPNGASASSFMVDPGASGLDDVAIATDGTSALVVWETPGNTLSGRYVDPTGPQLPVFSLGNGRAPALTHDQGYVLTWSMGSTLMAGAISGQILTPVASPITEAINRDIASFGGVATIVYEQGSSPDVFAVTFDGASFGAPQIMGAVGSSQRDVAMAFNGSEVLAVWNDMRSPGEGLRGVRLDGDGTVQGAVIDFGLSGMEGEPAVASDGDGWLVVWRQGDPSPGQDTTIAAARVAADGTVTALPDLASGATLREPTIAFDGSSYLVTFEEGFFACEVFCNYVAQPLVVRQLGVDGTLLSSFPVDPRDGLGPALAQTPTGAVIAWEVQDQSDLAVTPLENAAALPTIMVSQAPLRQSAPAVASSDAGLLVVWEDTRIGVPQIYGARLDNNHAVLDVDGLLLGDDFAASRPRVVDADDGYSYLVAWDGASTTSARQVLATWVKREGTVLDPDPVVLSLPAADESSRVDLTAVGAGRMLVGYQRHEAFLDAERVAVRAVDSGAVAGEPCATTDDCASRFCVAGLCCESACDGRCESCPAGICEAVTNGPTDRCFDTEICDADGECKAANGQACGDDDEVCASGHCVDGLCCDTPCDGACDRCNVEGQLGTCQTRSCSPFSCNPDKSCRESCSESRHCEAGFQCVNGLCSQPTDVTGTDRGCGCEVVGARSRPLPTWPLALLGLLWAVRRQRF